MSMPGHTPIRVWVLPAVVLLAARSRGVGIDVRHSGGRMFSAPARARSVPAVDGRRHRRDRRVRARGLVLVPIELLALAAGLLFGPVRGSVAGDRWDRWRIRAGLWRRPQSSARRIWRSWMRQRSYRSGQQLGRRGVVAVAVLRLSAVGSAGSIQLMCGAARVPFAGYLAGRRWALRRSSSRFSGLGALLRRTMLASVGRANGADDRSATLLLARRRRRVLRAFFLIRQFSPPADAPSAARGVRLMRVRRRSFGSRPTTCTAASAPTAATIRRGRLR